MKAKKKMLTPSQYAEKVGKPYQTIMAWLRKDLIEGAEKTEIGKMFVYLIPEDAGYVEPPMGRPPKPVADGQPTESKAEAAPVEKSTKAATGKKAAKKSVKK